MAPTQTPRAQGLEPGARRLETGAWSLKAWSLVAERLVAACLAVKCGDRVAQLVLERIYTPEVREVDSLEETARGAQHPSAAPLSRKPHSLAASLGCTPSRCTPSLHSLGVSPGRTS